MNVNCDGFMQCSSKKLEMNEPNFMKQEKLLFENMMKRFNILEFVKSWKLRILPISTNLRYFGEILVSKTCGAK